MNNPSPIFITPALWHATIFFLFIFVAYSKAYLLMFSQALWDMIFKFSTTPGTTWCSSPEYYPYVFSLIVTTSTCPYGVLTPSILLHGRTLAYNFNFFLKVTFNDLKPFPIGVSNGPFKPYLSSWTLLIVSAEIKSPYSVCPFVWIWWCSNSIGTLAASNMSTTDFEIYGPIPFPGKRTTFLF